MRYFPGEDEAWGQKWTRKLIQQLNSNNLLKQDSHEDEKKTAIPSPEIWNDVQALE